MIASIPHVGYADAGHKAENDRLDMGLLKASFLHQQLLDADEVRALPPPQPLIGDVMHRRKLVVVSGKPGTGKSFLALDWSMSVATGSPWLKMPVHAGAVLYIAAEGTDGLGRRIDAWQHARGVDRIAREKFLVLPRSVNLLSEQEADGLVALCGDLSPVMVVIDTLARCMTGGDENDSRDVGKVIDAASRIQVASAATVLLIHHDTREGSNPRGHSSLDGAVDASIECKGTGDAMTIRSRKQKDSAAFEDLHLIRKPVRQSCVLVARGQVGANHALLTDGERQIVAAARVRSGSGGLRASELRNATGMVNASFFRALKSLVDRGAPTKTGTKTRPVYQLTEASNA